MANGFSFHVVVGGGHDALRGTARRVPIVLLHGFVQSWWAWRHQLSALDLAGHPVAAVDLRGYGASDRPPRGYDHATLARDVAGIVRGLGHRRAVIVGHDLGGAVGWATAAFVPDVVAGLVSVSTPGPGSTRRSSWPDRWRPARSWSAHSGRRVERYLRSRTSQPDALDLDSLTAYRLALLEWPAPQRALAAVRHSDRAVRQALLRRPIDVDLLTIRGSLDRVVSRSAMDRTDRFVAGHHVHVELPGIGHLVPEEDPDAVTTALLDWLAPR